MHLRTDSGDRQRHFSRVPTISRERNAFTVAKKHVSTFQFDYLYPIYSRYVNPGSTISVTQECLARLATQVGTLYDDLYIDLHAWFVQHRLVDSTFNRMQYNEQNLGPTQDNTGLETPSIDLSQLGTDGFGTKNLYDCLGFPTEADVSGASQHVNNYEARSYYCIWDNNYRDQNLQNALIGTVDYFTNGVDDPTDYVLQKRGRRHDKFSSALTSQQKGVAPTISLSGTTPVTLNPTTGISPVFRRQDTHALLPNNTIQSAASTAEFQLTGGVDGVIDPNGTLQTAVSLAFNVNTLRQSVAIQHLLEADARGGTRAVEAIQHRWGVTLPDEVAQRPMYCGGATYRFDGHIVPQTSETGTTPQATLKQFSQTMARLEITQSFQEHGIFMILMSCRSNLTYQQGLSRHRSMRTRYDFTQPEFFNLGEVAVLNKEINMDGTSGDDEVWAYQEYGYHERYDDNMVTNEMRSSYATSKDSLHMADDYGGVTPSYNAAWIESDTPIGRNIVVQPETADPIEMSLFTVGKFVQTLPMYSVPGLYRL